MAQFEGNPDARQVPGDCSERASLVAHLECGNLFAAITLDGFTSYDEARVALQSGISLRCSGDVVTVYVGNEAVRPLIDFDGHAIVDEFGEWTSGIDRSGPESYWNALINGQEFISKFEHPWEDCITWWSITACEYSNTGQFKAVSGSAWGRIDKTESDG